MGKREDLNTLLIAPSAKRITGTFEFLLENDGNVNIALFRFDQTPSREEVHGIRHYLDRAHTRD